MDETAHRIERIVLLNAWEDYGFLWQILNEVRASMPSESEASVLRAARTAVLSLLNRELVDVHRQDSRHHPIARLDDAAGIAAINTDAYWYGDPHDTVEIAVATTPKGNAAYEKQEA